MMEMHQGLPTAAQGRFDDGVEHVYPATVPPPTCQGRHDAETYLTDRQVRHVRELCAEGEAYEVVAVWYRVAAHTVQHISSGETRRSAGGPIIPNRRQRLRRLLMSDDQWAIVDSLRADGVRWDVVGQSVGIGASTLQRAHARRKRERNCD